MKKSLLSLGVSILLSGAASSQVVIDTVYVGANYANQKWYSLANDEAGTQAKDNWDIAFEITGISSSILANTQKTNFAVYNAPFKISDYGIIDTSGIKNWMVMHNSDTSWSVGAFNRGKDPNDAFDMGWGVYNMSTHFVDGDSCFVIKLSNTSYKKLKIESLAGGVYTFEYADLNGANSFTQTITKTNYTGKNFAYFDLSTNTAVDREPLSTNWDLTFGRYTAILYMPSPTPYPVVGIMQNKGVYVAQMNNVANPNTFIDTNQVFNTNITTIGHDWKKVDIMTSIWTVVKDTIYFVKDKGKNVWKVRPMAFTTATGEYIFSKERLSLAVGIADVKGAEISKVMLYPNPSNGSGTSLLFSSDKAQSVSVSIVDLNGRVLSEEKAEVSEGLTTHNLGTAGLQSGVYFVKLSAGSYSSIQKLIIQ